MIRSLRLATGLLLPLWLAGCGVSSFFESDANERGQPFPASYKSELLAFFRNYLNDPVAVHDALMAEPIQRAVGGQSRYVSCLKFNPRNFDGSYRGLRERVVLFKDGRLDRVIEEIGDLCAGASYAPFPELEQMSR